MVLKFLAMIVAIVLMALSAQADNATGHFSEEQICQAGIATNNWRSVKGIRFLARQGKIITVAYTRDDGEIFGYACQIEEGEIRWRDQSMTRWNKNIKLYYSFADGGTRLHIRSVVFGEAVGDQSFTTADFQ